MPWPLRRLGLAALLGIGLGLAGCAGRPPAAAWTVDLPWGSGGVAVGREGGRAVGPLAASVAPGRIALLDTFGERVLVWTYRRGRWDGPAALPVPSRAPLVALALPAAGAGAVVADGAGAVWSLTPGRPARRILDLPSSPGDLRRVVSVASVAGGGAIADVVEVTAQRSARRLVLAGPSGPPRTLAEAVVARPEEGLPESGWLLAPAGVRSALAPAAGGGLWLAGAKPPNGQLVLVGLDGRPLARRPLPALAAPADFLGVDRRGEGYALVAAGTQRARLIAFDAAGRVTSALPLAPGAGPSLPEPVAVGAGGSVLIMTSSPQALQLRLLPPGRLPKAA